MKYHIVFVLSCFAQIVFAQPDIQKQIQSQLILAESGDTIYLPKGRIELTSTLSLDEKTNIVIIGEGQKETILSFKGQTQGAEGLKITNSMEITLAKFTIENAKGDLIKAQNITGLYFFDITAQWTGKPSSKNGGYGLYPVQCSNVVIARCTAIGASDSGIYVGQSDRVQVTHCIAKHNVAGIEIENTTNAEVTNCLATENTGGILIFDLPDLPKKKGGHVKIENNSVIKNNYRNFAPKGNIVHKVPPGTGIMVLATRDVLIKDNEIIGHKTASCAVVSYYITENPIKDTAYLPYPSFVSVTNNNFVRKPMFPTFKNKLGILFFLKFGRKVPNILWDGIEDPKWKGRNDGVPYWSVCAELNKNETFANLKAGEKFKGISRDMSDHKCY